MKIFTKKTTYHTAYVDLMHEPKCKKNSLMVSNKIVLALSLSRRYVSSTYIDFKVIDRVESTF